MLQLFVPTEEGRRRNRVVWDTEVPQGQVVTTLRGGTYLTVIMQASPFDGWQSQAGNLRRAKINHDGCVAMARGAEVYE
jgi:hypothetical protein